MASSPELKSRPVRAPQKPGTRNEALALAGVLGATFLTYASTIPFGWVYDDPAQIPSNPDLHWSRLGYLFTHHLWASTSGVDARFYRPLLSLWFLINRTLFGLSPQGFHLTTVLMHVAATALAYVLARRLFGSSTAALIVAAIFGLHPLHAETASWVSDVDDSLAAVFCFGAFLAYLKAREQPQKARQWWAVSLGCYAAGLLTKEVVLLLPAIILADVWLRRLPGRLRTLALVLISYGALALAYLAMRSAVLGNWAATQQNVPFGAALLGAPVLALFYLEKLLLPVGLSAHYQPIAATSVPSAQFWIAVVAFAALFAAGFTFHKALFGERSHSGVALAWLVVPIIPALNLALLVQDDPLHDRYAYLSVFGAALLATALWLRARECWSSNILRPALLIALVAMAFGSAVQSQYWSNNSVLFARAVTMAPSNPWAHWNYGAALHARGKYAEALAHFEKAYELVPDWRTAAYAGVAAQQLEHWPQAEQWFERSLQLKQDAAETWFDLGHTKLSANDPAGAIPALQHAIQLAPAGAGYHYDLGVALERTGRTGEAREQYRAELGAHPEQQAARQALQRLQAFSNVAHK